MVSKLSTSAGLPSPNADTQSWGASLVSALMQQLSYIAQRANGLLAADGTEAATAPVLLKSYTVSTVPTASSYTGGIIYVSDGTSNKRLAVSDGTNWRWPDGNVVS